MIAKLMLAASAADGVTVSLNGMQIAITGPRSAVAEWRPVLAAIRADLVDILSAAATCWQRRAEQFEARGVDHATAHCMAIQTCARDEAGDDRRFCLECAHLEGSARSPVCTNWRRGWFGVPRLPADQVAILHRCQGFRLASKFF